MGEYEDAVTGERKKMFHGTTGVELAEHLSVPYLGSIPFDPIVSQSGDAGIPAVVSHPETLQAAAFRDIAGKVAQQCSIRVMGN